MSIFTIFAILYLGNYKVGVNCCLANYLVKQPNSVYQNCHDLNFSMFKLDMAGILVSKNLRCYYNNILGYIVGHGNE